MLIFLVLAVVGTAVVVGVVLTGATVVLMMAVVRVGDVAMVVAMVVAMIVTMVVTMIVLMVVTMIVLMIVLITVIVADKIVIAV